MAVAKGRKFRQRSKKMTLSTFQVKKVKKRIVIRIKNQKIHVKVVLVLMPVAEICQSKFRSAGK